MIESAQQPVVYMLGRIIGLINQPWLHQASHHHGSWHEEHFRTLWSIALENSGCFSPTNFKQSIDWNIEGDCLG